MISQLTSGEHGLTVRAEYRILVKSVLQTQVLVDPWKINSCLDHWQKKYIYLLLFSIDGVQTI